MKGKTLKKYYQKEFQKIHDSKEAYKGKFNVCAFLFGPIWSAANPYQFMWTGALIMVFVAFFPPVGLLLYIVDCIYLGFRGTYKYYKKYVFHKKSAAWDKVTDSKN